MCGVVYCYVQMSPKKKLCYRMSSERVRDCEEIMYQVSNNETSKNILRMSPQTFMTLCGMLERKEGKVMGHR